MVNTVDRLWHGWLKRPYRLSKPIDQGNGRVVVLLHGLAASGSSWEPAASKLAEAGFRAVSYDLLGFGNSPAPSRLNYTIDDHAEAVIASIKSLKTGNVVLVGHSMGAIIAARVARLQPKLVDRLVLYQVPVYGERENGQARDVRDLAYIRILDFLAGNEHRTIKTARRLEALARSALRFTIDEKNWVAFEGSVRNTLLQEAVFDDIKISKVQTDVIYGVYDPLVLRKSMMNVFKPSGTVAFHKVNETHRVSEKTGDVIVSLLKKSQTKNK